MSYLSRAASVMTLVSLTLVLTGCSSKVKDSGKGAEGGDLKKGNQPPKGSDGTPKPGNPTPTPTANKETNPAEFPTAIIGKWICPEPSSAFHYFGFVQTEFTKDGRVLQFDTAQKKWVERYKYRFDKADLILSSPKEGGGSTEERITIASISLDKLVATSPMGELKRVID